ncbi:MAG: bifunctional 3,4-dihydroxy-2-butanone-4-phosphate synthase/GTP cyclohydrolase II [Candidatus Protistobacter heckmanni]|nr:bifunctional 3,4-dihydroxy-2-butanone-4-phosphate synthase/GTP cyclohydrolase II [Candidatus Protistobacter heckmanni]
MSLATTEEIIAEMRAGRMVILVDEEDRENEGDLVLAADFVTPEAINFMAKHGRGLICLTLTPDRCRQLNLPLMVSRNGAAHGTNFTVSIEAAEGVTTGISAADRARTVQAAVAREAKPSDLVQPGHIFPLMAQLGGVLMRSGHTEAGCDLSALAGCSPAAVICEVMKDDGSMARLPDLLEFGAQHGLKTGTIVDLIHYRSRTESIVERVAERSLQTPWGALRSIVYRDTPSGNAHLALINGNPESGSDTLVRVHEPLSALDLLEVSATSHSWNLSRALEAVAKAPRGVAVLLNCAGGAQADATQLLDQFKALGQPGAGKDGRRKTDFRTYGIGAQILRDVGVGKMRVLSTQQRIPTVAGYGLEVTGYQTME